jgi:hypothetical protein
MRSGGGKLLSLRLDLQSGNRFQIVRFGGCRQRARVDVPHFGENRIRLILRNKRAEPQAIAQSSVFGALDLVDVEVRRIGDGLDRLTDRGGGCTQIDHEGAVAAEPRRFRQGLEQIVDAQMPYFTRQRRICGRCHR